MDRRQFLSGLAALPIVPLESPARAMSPVAPATDGRRERGLAIDPIKRTGPSQMKLSLAAYSFRAALAGPKKSMTLDDFIDLASTWDLDGVEPTSYYFPDPPTPEYCRSLRRHAFLQGLSISGTAVRNTFTYSPGAQLDKEIDHVKRWIDLAAELHAPSIRIFAGEQQKGLAETEARRWCVEAISKCCEYAGTRGIYLALENHGGIVSTLDQMLAIVREVKSDWFGVNLDTGNFHSGDPYADLARLAPYAVVVQIKTEMTVGTVSQPADLPRLVSMLRDVNYRGYVVLEYEAEAEPRTAVPPYLQQLRKLIDAPASAASGA